MTFPNETTSNGPQVPTMLREAELAIRWAVSQRTLQRRRSEGCGPPFCVLGGSIRYRLEDILEFELRMQRGGDAE